MPMIAGSGRKIRPPIQAPLTPIPTSYTVCGQNNGNGRYFAGMVPRRPSITSPSAAHAQSVPSPSAQQPQPPLITDTLTACLDVNGTYICTQTNPRCYIIQKVTPNTLRVSPSSGIGIPTGLEQSSLHPKSCQAGHQSSERSTTTGNESRRRAAAQTKDVESIRDQQGINHMNCEIGVTVTPSATGEERGLSPMGIVSKTQCTPAPYSNDSSSINGVGDGAGSNETMTEAQMRSSGYGDAVVPSTTFPDGFTNNNEPISSDLPTEELRQKVLAQLEYYFSPDNLATDQFLVSQMDSDQYVKISTVADFNMIKKLSSDLALITDVLRESKRVQVHTDGKRVRPISNRTVVILRGIPEGTPMDEITALFSKENSPRCNQCEFVFNDSWYLNFDSEDEAMRAHRYLREEVREFKGQPIMARIKSRPTTLLGPGMGVNLTKNGYHQPTGSLPTYMTAPFVPVSQTSGTVSSAASTPIYATPQQVSSAVFTMPPNPYGTFGAQLPWGPGFFELNSSLTPIYMNGIPSQSPNFQKSMPPQMLPRHRTSKSESESINGPPPPRGSRRTNNGNNGAGDAAIMNGFHIYPGNPRKGNNQMNSHGGHALPAPLLSMAPPQPQLTNHVSSHSQSQSHSSSHSTSSMSNSASSTSHGNRNGHLHYSSLPPQSVPHGHSSEPYHRPYRGGDARPRSSLGVRRGGPNRAREEEGACDGNTASSATSSSNRRYPSTRGAPPAPPSPQPIAQAMVSSHTVVQTNGPNKFDLEVSSFPPLPGAPNSAGKNGDSPYEGRLSDVVKGVKSLKVSLGASSTEKEVVKGGLSSLEPLSRSTPSASDEIVVSACGGSSTCAIYVVSAASPTREVEGTYKEKGTDPPSPPSHVSAIILPSAANQGSTSKKEFREVGVGSADDKQEICASSSMDWVVSGARIKETADKSTQSIIMKSASTSTVPTPSHSKTATENSSKKGPRSEEDSCARNKETSSIGESGRKSVDENCSSEVREGPSVRLSYAQVAQRTGASTGSDKPAPQLPIAMSAIPPVDGGKRVETGRGKDQKESPRSGKGVPPGFPQRNGNSNSYKRLPFPNSNRRERIFSNVPTNRTSQSRGATGSEDKC